MSSSSPSSLQVFSSRLQELVQLFPARPISRESFDTLVTDTLAKAEQQSSPENRKATWEFVLKDDIFSLAVQGRALKDPQTTYYDDLRDRLDLILTFTEHDACDAPFPFNVLYDLMETQTISSCSHIFSWIESRADRLTAGMQPQKGKALVLLRTLNDLLRRLSKIGGTTMFCGRILTFLSSVYPLGERSGVNLRGEYGPVWDGPGPKREEEKDGGGKDEEPDTAEGDKMQVDEEKAEGESSAAEQLKTQKQDNSDDFYHTFWSCQLPFSRPAVFAEPKTMTEFKEAVSKVLPVIKEATARERAMTGSKSSGSGHGSLKRKREPETVPEWQGSEYFFAKYLTSPDLLELEIADTHFRRQFLFQLLVLLHHLLGYAKQAKAEWTQPRNRSLQMDFTLEPTDVQWVTDTITRANEELRQTSPNGRAFAETVNVILEREKNWVKWKNELCAPFDKEPFGVEVVEEGPDGSMVTRKIGLEEATREARRKMSEDPPQWEHKYGTAPLTEIWELGYRQLSDLESFFDPGTVKDYVKKVQLEDMHIARRKRTLAAKAEHLAAMRAKTAAAAAAAAATSELKEIPAPVAKPALTPSTSQENVTASTPPPLPRTTMPPNTPPLHHPLPAKPITTSIMSPAPQENTPSIPTPAPATPAPAPAPVLVTTPAPPAAPVTLAPPPEPVLPPDEIIMRHEENKQRISWLALRIARDQYISLFGGIGTGDIIQLSHAIEKAAQDAEKAAREEEEKAAQEKIAAANPPSSESEGAENAVIAVAEEKEEEEKLPAESQETLSVNGSVVPAESVSGVAMAVEETATTAVDVPEQDAEGDVKMDA
ncbi:hypothetical protein EIP91_011164 [Steccherinum ochraceum]|uniref:THO complex subunit 1 n=1 Tax=Steccherinum ochraceum TaxID=92696 RepID=A0A4R0RQ49_9APHY|nr:hypothetical protein EIP91_011164 [Steccherinum ochraceum]